MPKKDISEELDCNPWKITKTGWVLVALAIFLGLTLFFVLLNQNQSNPETQQMIASPQKVSPPIKETLEKASSNVDPRTLGKVKQETMEGLTAR